MADEMTDARKHVVSYAHVQGEYYDALPDDVHNLLYIMADGFGPLGDGIWDVIPEWDWSHIRDSTEGAFEAMSGKLKELGYMPDGPASPPAPR